MWSSSSKSCSATAKRRQRTSCSTSTTRAALSSRTARGRRPSSMFSASTSTASGPRCNRTTDVFGRARIRRTRRGTYRVDLPPPERDVLARLLPQLRQLVSGEGDDDGRSRRLFPTAYAQDAEADADYQRLMREELVASRLAAIETVE